MVGLRRGSEGVGRWADSDSTTASAAAQLALAAASGCSRFLEEGLPAD